ILYGCVHLSWEETPSPFHGGSAVPTISEVRKAALLLLPAMLALSAGLAARPLPRTSPPGKTANPPAKKEQTLAALTDLLVDPLPDGAHARIGTLRFRCPFELFQLTFAPTGRLLAVAGDDGLHLWEFPSGKERFHIIPARGSPNDPT